MFWGVLGVGFEILASTVGFNVKACMSAQVPLNAHNPTLKRNPLLRLILNVSTKRYSSRAVVKYAQTFSCWYWTLPMIASTADRKSHC